MRKNVKSITGIKVSGMDLQLRIKRGVINSRHVTSLVRIDRDFINPIIIIITIVITLEQREEKPN